MGGVATEVVEVGLVIGGDWREPRSGERREIRNPANLDEFVGYAAAASRRDAEDAIAAAAEAYGLCSSVWSADVERAISVARRLEAGYTYINHHGPFAQDNRVPFGGVKESGVGRQLGIEGVLEFVDYHPISIYE